jgi:hypothetical protein
MKFIVKESMSKISSMILKPGTLFPSRMKATVTEICCIKAKKAAIIEFLRDKSNQEIEFKKQELEHKPKELEVRKQEVEMRNRELEAQRQQN